MKKPSFATLASVTINLLLSASLINIYLTDTGFKGWVDQYTSGNAFTIVLTISLVTGSLFGYVLLRRKPSRLSLGRLQRTGPMKQPSPFTRPAGLSATSKNIPVGAPPGPTSKHTAYAVPSLSTPSTQPPQRQTPSSWSSAPKQWTPESFRAQQEEQRESGTSQGPAYSPQQRGLQPFSPGFGPAPSDVPPRSEPPREVSGFSESRSQPTPPSPVPPPFEETARTGSAPYWKTRLGTEGASERTGLPFPTQPPEPSQRPPPPYIRQPSGPSTDRPAGFTSPQQSSHGQPADPNPQPNRWTGPAPAPGYSPQQKWLPPSVSPVPRQQSPMGPSLRPSPGPQGRPTMAGPQGPPRPLGYSGPARQPPGSEGPRLRPDESRPVGTGNQQPSTSIPPRPVPAQQSSQLGTRKGPPLERSNPAQGQKPSLSSRENQQGEPSPTGQSTSDPPTGEMDWDMALDAILKTLRKDKVEDKP